MAWSASLIELVMAESYYEHCHSRHFAPQKSCRLFRCLRRTTLWHSMSGKGDVFGVGVASLAFFSIGMVPGPILPAVAQSARALPYPGI